MLRASLLNIFYIKKVKKIGLKSIQYIVFFLLLISILLSLPFVQTKMATYFTKQMNTNFNVDLKVENVSLSVFGKVELKNIEIRDPPSGYINFCK